MKALAKTLDGLSTHLKDAKHQAIENFGDKFIEVIDTVSRGFTKDRLFVDDVLEVDVSEKGVLSIYFLIGYAGKGKSDWSTDYHTATMMIEIKYRKKKGTEIILYHSIETDSGNTENIEINRFYPDNYLIKTPKNPNSLLDIAIPKALKKFIKSEITS